MSAALKGTARKFLWDHSAFRCCYFLSLFLSSFCFVEFRFQILTGVTMVWSVLILIDIFRRLYPRKNLKYFDCSARLLPAAWQPLSFMRRITWLPIW